MKAGPDVTPSPLTVLDTKGMARWLHCSTRNVQRKYKSIPGEPGKYLVADVLEQIYGERANRLKGAA